MSSETASGAANTVRSAVRALNNGDLDGYLAHLDPQSIRWLAGPDIPLTFNDVAEGLRELADAFTGLQLEEISLFGNATSACARWRLHGKHTAPYGGHAASGRIISVQTCEVYEFNASGLVTESWVYGDMLAIFDQIAASTPVSA